MLIGNRFNLIWLVKYLTESTTLKGKKVSCICVKALAIVN